MARNSKDSKSIDKLDLASGEFAGFYLLEDGNIMEAHESVSNWFDEDELDGGPEPDGAVYYTTYDGTEEDDGGLMGYMDGRTFADVIEFMSRYHQPLPVRMIAREGSKEYTEIEDSLGDPDAFARVAPGYGITYQAPARVRKDQWGNVRPDPESVRSRDWRGYDLMNCEYEGAYELEDGSVALLHDEAIDPSDWSDDSEDGDTPSGAVYYSIYRDGVEEDGGDMGYENGDKLSDLSDFMARYGQPRIKRLVALEYEERFDPLNKVLQGNDPKGYQAIKGRYGLLNRRPKGSKPKARRGYLG